MNEEQKKIIKNEAFLWSLVYPHFRVSENIMGTYSSTESVTPNSNQVFNWQSEEFSSHEYSKLCTEYQGFKQKGFYRQIEPTEQAWVEGYEYHLISSPSLVEAKKSKMNFKVETDVSANKDFIKIFTEAFKLPEVSAKAFLERMNGLSNEISLKYIIGYAEGEAMCVGGFYKAHDYWYLMNFGTSLNQQGKGYGTDYLSTVTRFLNEPIVFRTVNKALVDSVGPKSGYKVAIKSKMLPLEDISPI